MEIFRVVKYVQGCSEEISCHAQIQSSNSIALCQLSSDDTRDIFGGVGVSEESSRVCFNLSQREAGSSVHTIVQNTGNERSS